MVEDGHVSNSHQYDPSSYYLADTHKNDTKNNNNSLSCAILIDHNNKHQEESTDMEDELDGEQRPRISVKSSVSKANANTNVSANSMPMPMPMATSNCINQIRSSSLSSDVLSESDLNSHSKNVRMLALHHEKTTLCSADSNGSSHVERPPSQNFFDVTKDLEGGGGLADRNFPPEIHKTVIAFGILIFNFFLTTTSLAVIHDKVPKHDPLPDAVLGMVDARNWALNVSEILIILTTGIMLILVVLHKHRFIIFRRLFLMLSLLYFMRSVTMFVTVLPVSSKSYKCQDIDSDPSIGVILKRSFQLFLGMGLTINGFHTYCGDYIFSGHTTILVMSYLMISEYSPRRMLWLHWATWFMSLTGVLMVLLSHSHYTVDVIIGYFVTTRIFWMYHTCANNPLLKKRSRHNYLSREWWFFLFQYFECNVKGPLQPLQYR